MCRTQCLLALIALSIGAVHSWDIAITTGNQLEFYANETKINANNDGMQFYELTALAYDAVHNMLLFVDKQNDNASIFSYHIATKKYQSLVRRKSSENIQGVAFDPVKELLFWTDSLDRSIYYISLKPGYNNSLYGNLLMKMDDEIPRAIAVDSCRGYIYWTNTNIAKPTIEKARYDGSQREVIVSKNIYMPVSVAVDQHTQRLYWADDKEGIHYSIESSDLDGKNHKELLTGIHHQPNALTVSKDFIYWADWGYKSVWKLPKTAEGDSEPSQHIIFNEKPYGIVANYQIEDQTRGVPECDILRNLSKNDTAINDVPIVPLDVGLFCVHGVKVNGKSKCVCANGYTGDRCDTSVCHNYCLQGDCSVTPDSKPVCRCKDGFNGERCELSVCHGYCLNHGECTLGEERTPRCTCLGGFEGSRCESVIVDIVTTTAAPVVIHVPCNSTENSTKESVAYSSEHPAATDGEFVETSCTADWDAVRDPIIIFLGILCGTLFLACFVLIVKNLQLKRRPRIKKRIIVNKNVTPMTATPDQCEITIENCCNMNVCETPCFEPRSTIKPTMLGVKSVKDEKKNLISNMEYPDDY